MKSAAKDTKTKNDIAASDKRLQEIAETCLGTLSDVEVRGLLEERAKLLEQVSAAEEERRKEQERLEAERRAEAEKQQALVGKKKELLVALEELNRSISSDKGDDELLALVVKRKEIERQLEDLEKEIPEANAPIQMAPALVSEEKIPEEKVAEEVSVVSVGAPKESEPVFEDEFGREGIRKDVVIEEGSELHRYMDQLRNNTGSLGTFLQNMPIDAKKNKAFMLKVAEIDPAYAMHFADKDILKRDEDFNIRVASLRNPRNSGNALAEMLPEARTSKVVMAAVRRDHMNVKFLRPSMEGYDEILGIAKKGALEKIKELKEAADISLLVPQILQQDEVFMEEVKKIVGEGVGE